MINKFYIFFQCLILLGCGSDMQPKPNAYLSLEYPEADYKKTEIEFNFSFEHNNLAEFKFEKKSSPRLIYPKMKATLYLTYNSVKKNLDSLLNDAYKLPYKHISKAKSIPEKIFINKEKQVYGTLFSIVGNAASQHQFFLTDSLNHFLVGSLYFFARPNYDSIYPAVKYLEKDIIHLIETLEWE